MYIIYTISPLYKGMRNGKSLSRRDKMWRIWPRSGREKIRLFAGYCLRNVLIVGHEAARIFDPVPNNRVFSQLFIIMYFVSEISIYSRPKSIIYDDSRPKYLFTDGSRPNLLFTGRWFASNFLLTGDGSRPKCYIYWP